MNRYGVNLTFFYSSSVKVSKPLTITTTTTNNPDTTNSVKTEPTSSNSPTKTPQVVNSPAATGSLKPKHFYEKDEDEAEF